MLFSLSVLLTDLNSFGSIWVCVASYFWIFVWRWDSHPWDSHWRLMGFPRAPCLKDNWGWRPTAGAGDPRHGWDQEPRPRLQLWGPPGLVSRVEDRALDRWRRQGKAGGPHPALARTLLLPGPENFDWPSCSALNLFFKKTVLPLVLRRRHCLSLLFWT